MSRIPLDFKDQYFGCEIELTGITRATAAQTLADLFGTRAEHSGGGYDAYRVQDLDGKEDVYKRQVQGGGFGFVGKLCTKKALRKRKAFFIMIAALCSAFICR